MRMKIVLSAFSVAAFLFGSTLLLPGNSSGGVVLGDTTVVPAASESSVIPIINQSVPTTIKTVVDVRQVSEEDAQDSIVKGDAITAVQDTKSQTLDMTVNQPLPMESVEYSATNVQTGQTTYLGTSVLPQTSYKVSIPVDKRLPNSTYQISANAISADGVKRTITGGQVNVNTPPKMKLGEVLPVKAGPTMETRDTDGDGLSDAEELARGTSTFSADTDGDGFLDGDEVKKGFNPAKPADGEKSDKVSFQSPKENAPSRKSDDRFRVEKIERVKREDGKDVTKLSGKGLPNSFVNVYIYSDPIVVTVKTDENGNWSYELDKDLEDGDHEVYVAVTDNVGRITAQSSPLPFVKTAQAISVKPQAARAQEVSGNRSPLEQSQSQFLAIGVTTILLFLLIGVYVVGRRAQSSR